MGTWPGTGTPVLSQSHYTTVSSLNQGGGRDSKHQGHGQLKASGAGETPEELSRLNITG